MEFSISRQHTDEPLASKYITSIRTKKGLPIIQIKASQRQEYGIELLSSWILPANKITILDCYKTITKEIETYPDIDYETVFLNQKQRIGRERQRVIPQKKVNKTFNILNLAKPKEKTLGINSNYGFFRFKNISENNEYAAVCSPFNLSTLVSKLLVESNLINKDDQPRMEQILDKAYTFYFKPEKITDNTYNNDELKVIYKK